MPKEAKVEEISEEIEECHLSDILTDHSYESRHRDEEEAMLLAKALALRCTAIEVDC